MSHTRRRTQETYPFLTLLTRDGYLGKNLFFFFSRVKQDTNPSDPKSNTTKRGRRETKNKHRDILVIKEREEKKTGELKIPPGNEEEREGRKG